MTITSREQKESEINVFEVALQQYLRVYGGIPNPLAGMSQAELIYARKLKSVFDKLPPCGKRKNAGERIAGMF